MQCPTGSIFIRLHPIFGQNALTIISQPDMPAYQFYRSIVPLLGYPLKKNEVSCEACVQGENGKLFDYANRLLPLKDFVNEDGNLYHIAPNGKWDYIGNASPKERGSNDVCAICFEDLDADDYQLTLCPHRGHKDCFVKYKKTTESGWKCPLCKEPFSPGDRSEFGLPSAPLLWG